MHSFSFFFFLTVADHDIGKVSASCAGKAISGFSSLVSDCRILESIREWRTGGRGLVRFEPLVVILTESYDNAALGWALGQDTCSNQDLPFLLPVQWLHALDTLVDADQPSISRHLVVAQFLFKDMMYVCTDDPLRYLSERPTFKLDSTTVQSTMTF